MSQSMISSQSDVTSFLRAVVATTLLSPFATGAFAADWPSWRGPNQTGTSTEKAAVTSWSLDGQNVLWKSDIGGRTTPIVHNGRVFLIAPVGEGITLGERV